MKATKRIKRLPIWTLMLLVSVCAAGCGENKRPWSGEESVLTFTDAVWVELQPTLTGERRVMLISATWKPEKGLTIEDIGYLFRGGIVLTPGFGEEVLQAFAKEKP